MNIIKELIKINAIGINTEEMYTWTSGIKSPIYCDNRLIMSYPKLWKEIIKQLSEKIKTEYSEADLVAGVATAGIPHAAAIAQNMELPMVYIRSEAKKHGKKNQVEGDLNQGSKVVVVEDLLSTGGSALDASLVVREEGKEVAGVLSIFSYQLKKCTDSYNENNLKYVSLLTIDDLLSELELTTEQKEIITNWRDNLN